VIFRHEVQLAGRRSSWDLLFTHRRDTSITSLEEIPNTFKHWDADWENAVHLKESRIFYVYTDVKDGRRFLTIWYEL
jgi:hypothetical protein